MALAFTRSGPASRNTRAPASTSLWPERYLVSECITTSAPSFSGCCSSGVAQVLSKARNAPAFLAIAARARMSVTWSIGLDGVSAQISLVAGVTAPASSFTSHLVAHGAFSRPSLTGGFAGGMGRLCFELEGRVEVPDRGVIVSAGSPQIFADETQIKRIWAANEREKATNFEGWGG